MRILPSSPTGCRGARGFTLVEVLVALAIGTLILAALAMLFSRNSGNQNELERSSRMIENARYALDEMVEELMHAGYYGEFNPDGVSVPLTYDAALIACPGAVADLKWVTATAAPFNVTVPVSVRGLLATDPIACGAATANRTVGTQGLIVSRVETGGASDAATPTAGNLYVQVSRCTVEPQKVQVGSAAADFTLRLPGASPTACGAVNTVVRRAVQRTYYVAGCNDCAAGDGVPTLRRIEWINGALRDMPIAEGVENLQLEYGVDTTPAPPGGDGQPDVWVGPAGVTGVGALTWDNVVAVRVHLLTRATQASPGYTDPRTYTMGAVALTPADGFRRALLTTTVRLHNVAGRRE